MSNKKIQAGEWYTVAARKPKGAMVFKPVRFPKFITGSREIAERHLLNSIAGEGRMLSLYGFDGINWEKLS
jgi:hypothetical protein